MTVLYSILPIFLLIAAGVVLQKILPKQPESSKLMCKVGLGSCVSWTSVLNQFALYLALPALIIHSLITTSTGGIISVDLIIFNAVALVVFLLLIYGVAKKSANSDELINTYLFGGLLGNVAYIGPPFINSLFDQASGTISILIAVHIFIAFSFGVYILERSNQQTSGILSIAKSLLKNPLIIAVIVGVIIYLAQIPIPEPIVKFLSMLAQSASPVVLIAIGTFLVKHWSIKQGIKHVVTISAIKLLAMPLLFAGALLIFPNSQNISISILEAAMPVALTNFALAEMYKMDRYIMSSAIIISTITSVVTLSVLGLLLI